ncbi:MAG: N-6 DNA methylase [Anaerolineales bacterium]|nr:N-6 DNA methylase [Anaerolineales bacterium]
MEFLQYTHRLALVNLMPHGLEPPPRQVSATVDTPAWRGAALPKANTPILTNPPFGIRRRAAAAHAYDLTFPPATSSFRFVVIGHLVLKAGGRAAVVPPDNVLFEANTGRQIRADLMECNLHTILRHRAGILTRRA